MKIITEADYKKLDKEAKEAHHQAIRDDLIAKGLIKPQEVDGTANNTGSK